MRKLTIGTRGSALALWQAEHVAGRLRQTDAAPDVELQIIKTRGDKILDVPLAKVGGKGLFVKEIEEALRRREIDLAVHSMKDVPSVLAPGLILSGVPEREDARDALISRAGVLADLPEGANVGTSSLRRGCQLLGLRPDLTLQNLRGNVDTRLRKLKEGQYDAIVLAAAGLKRLGLQDRITELLSPEVMLPAVGQGALGIETRQDDAELNELVRSCLHHASPAARVAGARGVPPTPGTATAGGCAWTPSSDTRPVSRCTGRGPRWGRAARRPWGRRWPGGCWTWAATWCSKRCASNRGICVVGGWQGGLAPPWVRQGQTSWPWHPLTGPSTVDLHHAHLLAQRPGQLVGLISKLPGDDPLHLPAAGAGGHLGQALVGLHHELDVADVTLVQPVVPVDAVTGGAGHWAFQSRNMARKRSRSRSVITPLVLHSVYWILAEVVRALSSSAVRGTVTASTTNPLPRALW